MCRGFSSRVTRCTARQFAFAKWSEHYGDMAKGRVSEVGERVGEQVNKTAEALGDYLKEQRTQARLSLRPLPEQAGPPPPYRTHIERGLRKPSAEVLQQIARAMRISAESLYVRAGIVNPADGVGGSVELAVLGDTRLAA